MNKYKKYLLLIIIHLIGSSYATINISEPGNYTLPTDVFYDPTNVDDTILIISSNDVIVDFNNHLFVQSNFIAGLKGIVINKGLSHITIKNGTLKNLTGKGIVIEEGCSDITIENMTTFSCDLGGIALLGSTGTGQITRSNIIDCMFINCSRGLLGDMVLTITNSNNINIKSCNFVDNGVSEHDLAVIQLADSNKCFLKDLTIKTNIAGTQLVGVELNNVADSFFNNCIIKDGQAWGSTSTAYGFALANNSDDNEFIECCTIKLTGTTVVNGFLLENGCDNNLFIDCRSQLHQVNGSTNVTTVHGFLVKNTNKNSFLNCIAKQNIAPSSTAPFGAVGFEFNNANNCLLLNCLAADHSGGTTPVGINVISGTQCEIRDCDAVNNNIGFRVNPLNLTNHVFIRNKAIKNTDNYNGFILGSIQETLDISGINATLTNPWTNIGIN